MAQRRHVGAAGVCRNTTIRWSIGLVLLGLSWSSTVDAACTGSSPTWTSSIDRTSVASCVSSAVDGDTINVAAGTAAWTSSISITNKGLTIIGAGTDASTGSRVQNNFFFLNNADNTSISGFRVTSIDHNESGSSGTGMAIQGTHDFRIHHNYLSCDDWDDVATLSDRAKTKSPRGLYDHNTMVNCRYIIRFDYDGSDDRFDGNRAWFTQDPLGTQDNIFFEDNTVDQTNCFQGNSGMECNWIDGAHGGSYVARFNTIVNTYLECHSNWGSRGMRMVEAYYNTFNCTGAHCSGGTTRPGLMKCNAYWHNNATVQTWGWVFFMDDRATIAPFGFDRCDGTTGHDGNTAPTATYRGWPCQDAIGQQTDASLFDGTDPAPAQSHRPSYAFNNTDVNSAEPNTNWCTFSTENCDNGTEFLYQQYDVEWNPTHIKRDRDIFVRDINTTFNGTTGVGVGTLAARPATCTTNPSGLSRTVGWGPGYWCTNCGASTGHTNWNTSSSNSQGVDAAGADGVLFVCTATNTWTAKYTPYTYPHPLQGGASSPPAAPTNVRVAEATP